MNWLQYLFEANVYIAIFYLLYAALFTNETYYRLNRIYLLASCVAAYILPLVQLGVLRPAQQASAQIVAFLPVATTVNHKLPDAGQPGLHDYLLGCYLAGVVIMVLLLTYKVHRLAGLIKRHGHSHVAGYRRVMLPDSATAFSFFNYLFIGTDVNGSEIIIRHELVHIRHKHSVDILFFELIKIMCWFNPLVYLMQSSLKAVHEYIADENTAASEKDRLSYSSFLVNSAYGVSGASLTHSFFNYNLLKKRIIMLHQKRSGSLARLKYLTVLPVCAALLCSSTLAFSKSYALVDLLPQRVDSVKIGPPPAPKPPRYARHIKSPSAPASLPVVFKRPNPLSGTTAKGYKYAESGYLVKDKTDYRVIIADKNGEQKEFFKSSSTPAQVQLLKEKYGYSFPTMPLYSKLPPPPPMAPGSLKRIEKRPAPPPPAPPKTTSAIKLRPVKIINIALNAPPAVEPAKADSIPK